MIELGLLEWTLLATAAFIVGLSKTAFPGAATLAVVLFASVLPARESTAALLVLLIIGDLFAIWMYRKTVDWLTLRMLIWPVIVGLVFGTLFLGLASDGWVRRVIGLILFVLLGVSLWQRRRSQALKKSKTGRLAGYFFGSLGGFTTMVANAGGPVMSLYLLSKQLSVATFLGTTAYFFFAINIVKVPFHIGLGLLNVQVVSTVAVLIPLVVVSALLGRVIAHRIPQKLFERLVLVLTAVGALNLLI